MDCLNHGRGGRRWDREKKGREARRGPQIETSLQIRREIGVKKESKNDSRVEWGRNGVFKELIPTSHGPWSTSVSINEEKSLGRSESERVR